MRVAPLREGFTELLPPHEYHKKEDHVVKEQQLLRDLQIANVIVLELGHSRDEGSSSSHPTSPAPGNLRKMFRRWVGPNSDHVRTDSPSSPTATAVKTVERLSYVRARRYRR